MKFFQNKKQLALIAAIVAIGTLLAALIIGMKPAAPGGEGEEHGAHADEVDHAGKPHDEAAEPAKGPHGGKLFVSDGFGLEITIFEQNAPPEFRIHTYQDGKPIDPAATQASVTLERLGRAPQTITFIRVKDHLKGDAVIEEPHSFKVSIAAQHGKKPYRFAYEQVEARVTMSEQQAAQNGVDIHTAGPARIKSVVKLLGEIQLNADRTVHVVPRFGGLVESVSANAGDTVRKGQVLAVLVSQGLADERAALLSAQKRLELARSVFEREQKLWQEKISAEQDYLQARSAMQEAEITVQGARQKIAALGVAPGSAARLARYEIRAPISGVVTDKRIAVGESVKGDAGIFVVADLSTVWVEVAVSARDLETVRTGQSATVRTGTSDLSTTGTIQYVSTMMGEQTRSAKARVVLPNPKGAWRPGLPVNVEVVAAEVTVPLAVSRDAIQTVRDEPAVFGRYGDKFEARPIEPGRSDGQFVEVLKGLTPGEKYAARNSFLIKADLGKSGASHDH
jgi:cobalt-zinc-cadmium efflux system membrane fusion protein